jgi:hypothetical protein
MAGLGSSVRETKIFAKIFANAVLPSQCMTSSISHHDDACCVVVVLGSAMPNFFSKRIGLVPKMGIFYLTSSKNTIAH